MEMEQFDDLTRRLGGAGSSRRQALRALAGALLGGTLDSVPARLGLVAGAEGEARGGRHHEPGPEPRCPASGQPRSCAGEV
ncbi:MAG: hypothetical protein K0Q71_3669 [Thermomicrobiales bacterium]|jgi:hypothetical protein|nr:hypothetical protein [Thermomicrobiales bacterium]